MRRWAYLGVPAAAVLLAGAWWVSDLALGAPTPDLGPAVIVTPAPPSPTPSPTATVPDDATIMPPAPPLDAGDDDTDDDEED